MPTPNLAETLLATEFDPSGRPFFAQVHARLRDAWAKTGPRSALVDLAVERLIDKQQLTQDEAEKVFKEILFGEISADQIGALLVALQPEYIDVATLATFAREMREVSLQVRVPLANNEMLGDTCGTGSDTLGTFNVSTTIMFVLAAAGIKIAKHGNRAITSQCGSADVLEALDVAIDLSPTKVEECIKDVGIGFMFAPIFHSSIRNVQAIRRVLVEEMPLQVRARTVFNLLGPLANPARANSQILGAYSSELTMKFAETLKILGLERALVTYGECDDSADGSGMDELSTAGPTQLAELLPDGHIEEYRITPEEVGLKRIKDPNEYKGGDPKTNARILVDILSNQDTSPRMDLALFNAGAGLYIGGAAPSIPHGVEKARQLIEGGEALRKFEAFRAKTQELRLRPDDD